MKFEEFYDFVVKVHSIAKIGLTYSTDKYALDNYNELMELSKEMLEKFMDVKFDRPSMFTRDIYPTPSISCRTIISNEKGEILLVQEANSSLWSLPGGWCDLYDSPATAAFNEVSQEAGVDPHIDRLVALLEIPTKDTKANIPQYVCVFEGSIDGKCFHDHTYETLDVKFFPLENLPPMSRKLSKEMLNKILEAYKNKTVIFD